MKNLFAALVTIILVCISLYIGLYEGVLGGVLDFIRGVKHTPIKEGMVLWGLIKFFFGGTVASVGCYVSTIIGASIASL